MLILQIDFTACQINFMQKIQFCDIVTEQNPGVI